MSDDAATPREASLLSWALPALGFITLAFTFFTGVPWVSKAEYLYSQSARDAQWREQEKINAHIDKDMENLEAALRGLETRLRALEQRR